METANSRRKTVTVFRDYLVTVRQEISVPEDVPGDEYADWASDIFGVESDTRGVDVVDCVAQGKWAAQRDD